MTANEVNSRSESSDTSDSSESNEDWKKMPRYCASHTKVSCWWILMKWRLVSPQDTYEAGPNGNEVLRPNPGTNILTTNHIYIYTIFVLQHICVWKSVYIHVSQRPFIKLSPIIVDCNPLLKQWSSSKKTQFNNSLWFPGLLLIYISRSSSSSSSFCFLLPRSFTCTLHLQGKSGSQPVRIWPNQKEMLMWKSGLPFRVAFFEHGFLAPLGNTICESLELG